MSTGFAYDDGSDDEFIFVDFGDQPLERFPALPEGVYDVRVLTATHAIAASGNKMLVLNLVVTDGEFTGRRLWEHLVYLPQCEWRRKEVLAVLTGGRLTGPQTLSLNSLVNLEAKVRVVQSQYNDKTTNDIADWIPADSSSGDTTTMSGYEPF